MFPEEIRHRYSTRHPNTVNLVQHFSELNLHPELREIVRPLRETAFRLVDRLPDGTELTEGLRYLLLAKEAFIRHYLALNNFRLTPQRIALAPNVQNSISQ